MFPAQEEADRTVFVGNLEARVREEILYELFLQVPGSSHSSEPANQSFESCVKINSHSYRNEEVMGRPSLPMQFFPTNNAALPQEYFFFQKMRLDPAPMNGLINNHMTLTFIR
uniref:RNA binding motif protein 11 n=1 Tax=Rousettus aegyptiacus TaxID=9407 RepID=A0A7J8HU66_ROUAE|nr:RNA binding motif protein 11 [Rousettus aegyptiacus]